MRVRRVASGQNCFTIDRIEFLCPYWYQVRYFRAPKKQICHLIFPKKSNLLSEKSSENCKKVWKARATSAWHGIKGLVESPCWETRCLECVRSWHSCQKNMKKSGVTGVISSDQSCSKASCFLACRLVDIFDEHCSFSDFFSKLCLALWEGRLVRKGPQSCLGQEMKADIRSGARFLKPWAPGLPCTDPRFHRSMQQLVLLWCISESLDPILVLGRNHCTSLSIATAIIHCELLVPILILVSIEDDKEPLAFSSSWQNLQLATRNVASILKP